MSLWKEILKFFWEVLHVGVSHVEKLRTSSSACVRIGDVRWWAGFPPTIFTSHLNGRKFHVSDLFSLRSFLFAPQKFHYHFRYQEMKNYMKAQKPHEVRRWDKEKTLLKNISVCFFFKCSNHILVTQKNATDGNFRYKFIDLIPSFSVYSKTTS